ncbi:MAG: helix-turn-helix domain-containing protein [Defluviitaleaceae bacterium]|nr:helix-turn-helix domain-containing protein [Defluviitaleaceae bacterium]
MTEKIKIALLKRKATIKELSEKLGSSQQNLSGKFRRDNFSMKELEEIAAALDCSLEIQLVMNDTGERI